MYFGIYSFVYVFLLYLNQLVENCHCLDNCPANLATLFSPSVFPYNCPPLVVLNVISKCGFFLIEYYSIAHYTLSYMYLRAPNNGQRISYIKFLKPGPKLNCSAALQISPYFKCRRYHRPGFYVVLYNGRSMQFLKQFKLQQQININKDLGLFNILLTIFFLNF